MYPGKTKFFADGGGQTEVHDRRVSEGKSRTRTGQGYTGTGLGGIVTNLPCATGMVGDESYEAAARWDFQLRWISFVI